MKPNWIERTILVRVGRHHFAFLRGYLEGLDLRALSTRYLETGSTDTEDLRAAKSILDWIRGQLMIAARRNGHYTDARLLRIDRERLKGEPAPDVPSLEEFIEDECLDGFSEDEVMQMFLDKYGDTSGRRVSARNERLRRRQLVALSKLEELMATDPHPKDPVNAWLHPSLADRLSKAGIATVGELVDHINKIGYKWWSNVPQFGDKAAAQVVGWLARPEVASAIGATVRPDTLLSPKRLREIRGPRRRETGIVPLEYFLVPPGLDGADGTNRGHRCTIRALNDHEALVTWLSMLRESTFTRLSYRTAAERLLLWAVLERKVALSSLTPEDCIEFRSFLERLDPATDKKEGPWPYAIPREQWLREGTISRQSEDWRPFEGPLDPKSRKLCLVILKRLFNWLIKVHYLHSNPWEAVPAQNGVEFEVNPTRSFTRPMVRYLLRHLESLPHGPHYERIRFVFKFAYLTGLRLSELVKVRLSDLERVPLAHGDRDGWLLKVVGKRNVIRNVPLQTVLMFELDRYLLSRGLEVRAACPDEKKDQTYLIGRVSRSRREEGEPMQLLSQDGQLIQNIDEKTATERAEAEAKEEARRRQGISTRALYGLVKEFFSGAAKSLQEKADEQKRLAEAAGSDMGKTAYHYDRYSIFADSARRLGDASTHWLRHTFGTEFVESQKGQLKTAQEVLGHSKITTTQIYIRTDKHQALLEMEAFANSSLLVEEEETRAALPSPLVDLG